MITRLAQENGKRLAQLAYRLTGNADLAEDLVQEALLTACIKVDLLVSHENQRGWLSKTLWNLAVREMRKSYHSELPLMPEHIGGEGDIALPMECYLPVGLEEKEREIILMRIDQGMSYAEIAEERGLSEEACRQQLSRAVRKCRALMEEPQETASI